MVIYGDSHRNVGFGATLVMIGPLQGYVMHLYLIYLLPLAHAAPLPKKLLLRLLSFRSGAWQPGMAQLRLGIT